MRIKLIAVGTRLPAWVEAGFGEYAKRMPPECRLELVEIAAERRSKSTSAERIKQAEARRLLAAVTAGDRIVALDERGRHWSSRELSGQMETWLSGGSDVALLVGGPDGLDQSCLAAAERKWALSALTLPHGLVRVLLAEQLYRAWSIMKGHPYHRD